MNSVIEPDVNAVAESTRTQLAKLEVSQLYGRRSTVRLCCVMIAYKAFIIGLVLVSGQMLPKSFNDAGYNANFHWPEGKSPGVGERFSTWDGEHYIYLSENGYHAGEPSAAFYPLWPLLISASAKFFGGHSLVVALVLSNLLSLFAWLLFYRLVALEYTTELADWATIFLVVYPGSLFFQFAYTESLFLLLAMLFFWGMTRNNLIFLTVAGFFLPMTRVVGLFCAIPLVVRNYLQRKPWRAYLPLCAIGGGWIAYLAAMQVFTGNPFEGFAAQKHFANGSISKLLEPLQFLSSLLKPLQLHGFFNSVIDRGFFVCCVAALFKLYRLNRVHFAYCVALGLIPAIVNSFMSYTRFLCVAFPVFIAVAHYFAPCDKRYVRYLAVAILFAIQMIFLLRHINFYWAG